MLSDWASLRGGGLTNVRSQVRLDPQCTPLWPHTNGMINPSKRAVSDRIGASPNGGERYAIDADEAAAHLAALADIDDTGHDRLQERINRNDR